MEKSSFKPGDVVQLRSGGPLMTVKNITPESDGSLSVNCIYWDNDPGFAEFCKHSFSPETIMLAFPPKPMF